MEGVKWNDRQFDDGVNIYLTGALTGLFHPATLKLMREYVVPINSDPGQRADSMTTRSEKYWLYRANADFLLMRLGLFHPSGLPFHAHLDRGSTYYAAAAGYRQEIDGGRSPLVEVLEKMCIGFNRYVGLLRFMKYKDPNFFGMVNPLSAAEIKGIEEIVELEAALQKQP